MNILAYTELAIQNTVSLLKNDSPTGYTRGAAEYLLQELTALGFEPKMLRKGTVICPLGGSGCPLALSAHVDTLGLMVKEITADGKLLFTRLGGPSLQAVETENVTVITRCGARYSGVIELHNASSHVNAELETTPRDENHLEVLLDEEVSSKADVQALGIAVGDIIALDPRVRRTQSGFIRSRFLDDKLSAGMLLALARAVANRDIKPARKLTLLFTVFEEVGHGASCGLPEDTRDLLVVDMGCVGDGLSCREQQVSICAKDSGGPYHYEMTSELISLCREKNIDHAVDVYPRYGSDAAAALRSGRDIRYALIGAGVYASHGYERSHKKGVMNTLKLIAAYVEKAAE